MKLRVIGSYGALALSVCSLMLVGLMIGERVFWRWFQGEKIGASTADWPLISATSFRLSFPWLIATAILISFAWDPTRLRLLRVGLVLIALVEVGAIWWMASAGLRPDPVLAS